MRPVRGKMFQFVLTGYLISCANSLFYGPKMFSGELVPGDQNVCTTQNVTFTSTLTQEPIPDYSIGFTIKTWETNRTYVTVDQSKIVYINETTVQYVHAVPPDIDVEKGNYIYINSYYWKDFGDANKILQIGKTTSAHVFPLPKQVVDLECIVNNYDTMRCAWKYGKYYGSFMPEVIFKWRVPSYSSSWTDCKFIDVEGGFCTWNETKAGYFQNSNITISLSLKQECNIQVDSEFHVDTSKIVKPNPVSNMKFNVINSTCLTLRWNTTNSGLYHPKEHVVIVSNKGTYVTNMTLITTIDTERLEHKNMFCGLRPYTEYSFTVSIKPTGTYSGYFSDPVQQTVRTYSDIPSSSPELTNGGYSMNHRDCEDGREIRRVCVFWKPIKPEHENGPMQGLLGNFSTLSPTYSSNKKDWAEYVTYGCSNILCNSDYLFTIKARNVNGTSIKGSTLRIPAFSTDTVRPSFIVESTNSSEVHISWTYTGNVRAREFLVAWCRNENGDCKTDHEVSWEYVTGNTTVIILHIDSPQDFLYGVSALTGTNQGTGIEWQDCVYLKHSQPKRKPQNVVVSTGAEDNSLVVTWDKLACTSNEPYIAMYNVQYYKENDGLRKSINVSQSGKARLVFQNLDEDQTYILTVRGVTQRGIYGPESLPQTGVPINKSLQPSEIVGITLAVLVCFIFAGIGVFCAVRVCKKRAQEAIKQAGNITIPEVPEMENSTSLLRRASADSGYNQSPTSNKTSVDYKLRNPAINLPYDYRMVFSGQHDTNEGTGSTKYPLTHTPDNYLSGKFDLLSGPSEFDTSNNKQTSKLAISIPKPTAFTSENEIYLYNQSNGTCDFAYEKKIDCEKISKSFGSLLDANHKCISIIPDSNKDCASELDQSTHKSNSYVQANDQYITDIPCPNRQSTVDNALVVDKDEASSVFTINKCQEIDNDKPYIDACNFSLQCQESVNNLPNKHDNFQFSDSNYISTSDLRVLQTNVKQTFPDDKANSEHTGSVTTTTQDADKISVNGQASKQHQEPTPTTTPSKPLESAQRPCSLDNNYCFNVPEQVKQGNDHSANLEISLFQNQPMSEINHFVDEMGNGSPCFSLDDNILFSSVKQKLEVIDTGGYVSHCQANPDQVMHTYSQDSTKEFCQERNEDMKHYVKEPCMNPNGTDETGEPLNKTQYQSYA